MGIASDCTLGGRAVKSVWFQFARAQEAVKAETLKRIDNSQSGGVMESETREGDKGSGHLMLVGLMGWLSCLGQWSFATDQILKRVKKKGKQIILHIKHCNS